MAHTKRSTVVGVFEDHRQAQQAVEELKRAGFREDEIGVISHNQDRGSTRAEADDRASHAGTGAVTGAVTGAGAGALWAIGIAAGVLPAIGPVVAGGILASILASAAGTAVAGGIVGALIGLGIPEEEAHYYESEFKSGRTIVTVKTESRYDEARGILHRFGAYDRSSGRSATAATTAACATGTTQRAATAGTSGQSIKVHEEQMHVHKQPQQTGEVKVRKEVHTEHKTLEVPVEREEVVVERRPASGRATASELREGQEIRIPVKEEQVSVDKQAVVKEEVEVGKRKVRDTETVSGDVRKEEVKVEQEGDVRVKNSGTKGNIGKRS